MRRRADVWNVANTPATEQTLEFTLLLNPLPLEAWKNSLRCSLREARRRDSSNLCRAERYLVSGMCPEPFRRDALECLPVE